MNDRAQRLRKQFDLSEVSFLTKMRPDMIWDVEAFERLTGDMLEYCREAKGDSQLVDRDLAYGFWFFPAYVRRWTSHPSFPRQYSGQYYEEAYRRLDDLAYWFFSGHSPYLAGHVWEPIRPC